MSIGPMIITVGEPIPWDMGAYEKGHVKQLTVFCPVRQRHYVISENTVLRETLVFASDGDGNFKTHMEVAGGKGYTLEELLEDWVDGRLYWNDHLYTEEDLSG